MLNQVTLSPGISNHIFTCDLLTSRKKTILQPVNSIKRARNPYTPLSEPHIVAHDFFRSVQGRTYQKGTTL